jgi:hypothetical protein
MLDQGIELSMAASLCGRWPEVQQREPVSLTQRRVTHASQDPFQTGTARGNVVRDGEVIGLEFMNLRQDGFVASRRSERLDEFWPSPGTGKRKCHFWRRLSVPSRWWWAWL